jgi:DNA-binding PadR family transcriptional regulator
VWRLSFNQPTGRISETIWAKAMVATTASVNFTAAATVLLAADDLTTAGKEEFSEWDLTVAAWSRDRSRFGLRGYAQSYPDHKRVMMEIMGQKASSPVVLKYLFKVRPNYYRLTPQGRAAAARLRSGDKSPRKPAAPVTVRELYDVVETYSSRPQFRRWQENPEEPREWGGALAFLGLVGKDARLDPVARVEEIRTAIRAAIDWCNVKEAVFLTRGAGEGGTPIHLRDLSDLLDFLQALSYRFPELAAAPADAGAKARKKPRQ